MPGHFGCLNALIDGSQTLYSWNIFNRKQYGASQLIDTNQQNETCETAPAPENLTSYRSQQPVLLSSITDTTFDCRAEERRRQEKYKTGDGFVVGSDDDEEGES
jgi:hypothetical protein